MPAARASRTIATGWLLVVGVILIGTSCSSPIDCPAPPAHETRFAGTVLHVDRGSATYRIDQVLDQGDPAVQPALEAGREQTVAYLDDDQQYLEADASYRVGVTPSHVVQDGRPGSSTVALSSTVDTPSCLAATVHADGSPIDTGLLAGPGARALLRWTIGLAAALLLLGAIGAGISAFIDRRDERTDREEDT